jgi:hypothetical protein
MASKALAVNVTVGGETYPAGSTPDEEIADQITNPKAWGDEPDVEASDEAKPAKKAAAKRPSK